MYDYLTYGELDGSDSQGPDISLAIVISRLQHFRSHPVGS